MIAGCGGGGKSGPATVSPNTLAAAARATQAAGSFTFTIGGPIDVAGQSLPIHGGGAVDSRTRSARVTLDLRQAVADAGLGLSPAEAQAEARAIGTAIYVRSPYLAKRRNASLPWMRFAPTQIRPLAYLRAVDVVKRIGTETVDGVRTTHYSTEIDFRSYAQNALPAEVPALNALMRYFGDSVPVDLWIDGSNRIRRIAVQLSSVSFQALPTVDLGGFGRPVAVPPPPAAEVTAAR